MSEHRIIEEIANRLEARGREEAFSGRPTFGDKTLGATLIAASQEIRAALRTSQDKGEPSNG